MMQRICAIKSKLALITSAIFLVSACQEQSEESTESGIWHTQYVGERMVLFQNMLSAGELSSYIQNNKQKDDSTFTPQMLSRTIAAVAHELGIDQNVLAGQIQAESVFDRNAVSRTGAVGYMQFTSIAYQECSDQLGSRGSNHARKEAIDFFRGKANSIYSQLTGKNFVEPWHYADWRSQFKADGVLNILCGGIIFKSFLSQTKTRAPKASMKDIYLRSLEDYNGETPEIKWKYTSSIMKHANQMASGGTGSVGGDQESLPENEPSSIPAVTVEQVQPLWNQTLSEPTQFVVRAPEGTAYVTFAIKREQDPSWLSLGKSWSQPFNAWIDVLNLPNGSYLTLATAFDSAGRKLGHRYNQITIAK